MLLGVPFAVAGSFWFLHILGYDLSIAVWVGIIALAGLYAETAIVFLLYLNGSVDDYRDRGLLTERSALRQAIRRGAVQRVRPIMMTIATDVVGLLPIMWSAGAGADVMKRIAAPLMGGVVTSGVVVLVLFPVVFYVWKGWGLDSSEPVRPADRPAHQIRQRQARRARLGVPLGTLCLAGANLHPNGASTAHGAPFPFRGSEGAQPPASLRRGLTECGPKE